MNLDNQFKFNTPSVKQAGWFLAIASVLLLTSIYLNRKFVLDLNNQQAISEKVTHVLHNKESRLEEILDNGFYAVSRDDIPSLDNVIDNDLYQKEGMAVFVTIDDSLVYWSDNRIPYETAWTAMADGTTFVRLKDGWYVLKSKRAGPIHLTGIILVKKAYPYQNAYLENHFEKGFDISPEVIISDNKAKYNIASINGDFLFSLHINAGIPISETQAQVLFLICLVSLGFTLAFLFQIYHAIPFFRHRKLLLLSAYAMDVIILKLIFRYAEIPAFIYDTLLFSPFYYATSWIEPSLGDMVTNRLILLILAFSFFIRYGFSYKGRPPLTIKTIHLLQLLFVGVLYFSLFKSIQVFVQDSSLILNLNDISNIDGYSLMGFASLTATILSYFLISTALIRNVWRNSRQPYEYLYMALIIIALTILFLLLAPKMPCQWPVCIIFAIYLLSFSYFLDRRETVFQLPAIVLYMILFAISTTFILNHFNGKKEIENRKMIASSISSKRDPLLEYEFTKVEQKIMKDSLVIKYFTNETFSPYEQQELTTYIEDHYFISFWNQYEVFLATCDPEAMLNIQPEDYLANCFEYFDSEISDFGIQTIGDNLYYIDNQTVSNSYLAILAPDNTAKNALERRIYVELSYKFLAETGLGYPELLIDKEIDIGKKVTGYSYARYYNERLIYKFGDYFYHLDFEPYYKEDSTSFFFNKDGFNHYVVQTDEDSWLVVSRKIPSFFDVVAPFSYLFLFFSLFLLIFFTVLYLSGIYRRIEMNFRNRFQISIIAIIIISLIILGFITRAYIINLNNEKNIGYLTERTYSVLVELEHKLGKYDNIPPSEEEYVASLLEKFSQVFFSDINVYHINGELVASSRPQIFDENLLSRKMNRNAFTRMAYSKSLLYIHTEQIGKQEYLSAYIPFRNYRDQIIAYLNLPYFAKQDEMRQEIADFISAYINIYVLLIVLAILITLLVSRYVTQPLKLIREKLRTLSYSKSNEKIEWKREDEIGELVTEYNRTLDELERSAELLARSERESAWREMAKQVAHEIKNPLTPMKLSVQYLKKAWDEKAADWEDRLERFSKTIIEQIESLSRIASEFSDFAKMPVASYEKIDLLEVIKRSAGLFGDIENVTIAVNSTSGQCLVSADRQQMLRVFNNLLNNAVQAIGKKENGKIDIDISTSGNSYTVEIVDNGSGIPEDQAERIFSPSFTTKSSGMGLGLAMVKNILSGIGASISFTSEEGVGTTFVLEIPALQ